jgi:hypothetical protein
MGGLGAVLTFVNEADGGRSGVFDRLRVAGAGSLVSSWLARSTDIKDVDRAVEPPAITSAATFNRAVETYLAHAPMVSWFRLWDAATGGASAVAGRMVIWEERLAAPTLFLAGSCETVYGLAAIDLKAGAVVIDVPPGMLGRISDLRQKEVLAIGPTGADKGRGGKVLLLPPDYRGLLPTGCIVATPVTYGVMLHVRGFVADGRPVSATGRMKAIRIYRPDASADVAAPPGAMTFNDGSLTPLDARGSDGYSFFDDLARLIARESPNLLPPHDRAGLAALGIEHGRPFQPDAGRRSLFAEAGRFGSAIARVTGFATGATPRLAYTDRRWTWLSIGGRASWNADGVIDAKRSAAFWTPRDASGAFLDGGRHYRLRLPANIPAERLWSVAVDDPERPSIVGRPPCTAAGPDVNADGSVDLYFGPRAPRIESRNWIRTVDGRGWFAVVRFDGPLPALFDQSWRPSDLEPQAGLTSRPA